MNKLQLKREREKEINTWLDAYNDYKALYNMFGDVVYHNAMMYCINKLRRL